MMDVIMLFTTIVLINSFLIIKINADIMVFNNYTHQIEVEFRDMPSLFGGIIPQDGIEAMLVYASPDSQACSPIAPPPNLVNYTGKWAVLIKRYNCTFEEKVRAAQNASYHIAIVHNVNSSDLEPMSAAAPQGIYIPSIFVGANTGNYLKKNYLYKNGYFVLIDDNSPDNKHLLVPFAIVVGICFFIMLGFMVGVIVKCIQDRRRAHRHRLPTSTLKKIPTAKFQKGDPYDVCAICIEDYVEGDKLRILPCSHAYHSKCVDTWLTRNRRVCPICKRKVFAAGEKPPAGASSDSDSDSDDDRTPLVLPSGRNGTQGGTFDNLSEDPLLRPLFYPSSYSSSAGRDQVVNTVPFESWNPFSETRSISSINSHATDVESNGTTNADVATDESNDSLTVPGTSVLPTNREDQPLLDNPRVRRSWNFWRNLFN